MTAPAFAQPPAHLFTSTAFTSARHHQTWSLVRLAAHLLLATVPVALVSVFLTLVLRSLT